MSFEWLATGSNKAGTAGGAKYDKTRLVLDAFYAWYCPELEEEVPGLCFLVEDGKYTLDYVMRRLCARMRHYAIDEADWIGPAHPAAIRFRLECFYTTYDAGALDRVPGLVDHVTSRRYPMTVVLGKMCDKYASRGALLADWAGDYPRALIDDEAVRRPPAKEPCAAPARCHVAKARVGDTTSAVINNRTYQGTLVDVGHSTFTVEFRKPALGRRGLDSLRSTDSLG